MSRAKHNVISYSKVDTQKIGFTDLEENDRIPSQKIGYIRYTHPTNGDRQFDIQTPEIKLDNYGIPDGEGPYYKTTSSRAFVKIPLQINPNVTGESVEDREKRKSKLLKFKEGLESIDKLMIDRKIEFFGSAKLAKKYSYQPIVRKPVEKDVDSDSDSDSDEEDVVVQQRPLYMKAKIPIEWETDNVTLDVYRVNTKGTPQFEEDGKHTLLSDVKTLDELRKHVGYMRTCRFILHACKIWASKQAANGQDTRKYGLTFKIRRVEVHARHDLDSNDDEEDAELFASSDDESEEVVTKFVASSQNESDEDSDDEPTVKVIGKKKIGTRKRAKKTTNV